MQSWYRSWGYVPVASSKEANLEEDLSTPSFESALSPETGKLPYGCEPKTRLRRYAALSSIAILTILATIVFIFAHPWELIYPQCSSSGSPMETSATEPSMTNLDLHPCGNSSAQARELGCTFHQLTWSWLPPDCPSYANDQFMEAAERPWVFYENREATKIAEGEAWEQVLNGELQVFGERREHVTHCMFMFLSMAEMIRDRTPYHAKLASYEHMEHCVYLVLGIVKGSKGWDELETMAGIVSFDQYCTESKVHPRPVESK
ncbi:hypothetical protein GQ53DRAFT_836056 [Thozetella sp. PMI_491]|nr:hypothetical protein GQ53DRAFT_836056 [Thozetella sp. PMI_491]